MGALIVDVHQGTVSGVESVFVTWFNLFKYEREGTFEKKTLRPHILPVEWENRWDQFESTSRFLHVMLDACHDGI